MFRLALLASSVFCVRSAFAAQLVLPAEAPRAYDALMALPWTEQEWQSADGAKPTRWNAQQWQVVVGRYRIMGASPTTSLWGHSTAIEFPDGTLVYRSLISSVNIYQFTYDKQNPRQIGSRLYYDIVHPTFWGDKRIVIGAFDITYSDIWQPFIDALKKWPKREGFLRYLKSQFGFEQRVIKVVLHKSHDNFWHYAMKPTDTTDGCSGWSSKGFFTLCPLNGILLQKSDDATVQKAITDSYQFEAFMHDTIHITNGNRCDTVRKASREPPFPAAIKDWFVEGIAEMGILQLQPRYKAEFMRYYYERLHEQRLPFAQANNPGFGDYRRLGTMFLQYLSETYGNSAIRRFQDTACTGIDEQASFRAAFGKDLESEYTAAHAYWEAKRTEIDAQYALLAVENLPVVAGDLSKDKCKRILPGSLPKSALAVAGYEDIPCIANAYAYRLGALEGKYEGNLAGLRPKQPKERVFLWKGGAYAVRGEGWEAIVSKDEFQYAGFGVKIINWPAKSDRQMQFADGTRVHCWNAKSGCSWSDASGNKLK